ETPVSDGTDVTVGGIVTSLRTMQDRKNNTMAFVTLEDFTGKIDGVVFGSIWKDLRELVRVDAAIFLQGKIDRRREAPSIKVEAAIPLAEAEGRLRVAVSADLVLEETREDQLTRLADLLARWKGDDSVFFTFRRAD